MKPPNNRKKTFPVPEILFYLSIFAAIACFAMVQSYGDPPDEVNRFKVVSFICRHGYLPHGADPEVLLDGYGASYAFQPMLTYIIQGFLLRFLKLFTTDSYVLLVAARMVNVVFGVLMAFFVRQTAKLLWKSPYLQWVFTIMTVFLPQNIFIHSYINTDSMAMLAVSIIYYALLRALRTDYDQKDCLLLALGIILCAMSYYNAYGIILAAMLIFALNYVHLGKPTDRKTVPNPAYAEKSGLWVEWAPLLRKGLFISAIVLLGISWWFIRNGILYDGDIIAMNARRECSIQTAAEELNPLTRFTFRGAGISLVDMLTETDYIVLVLNSFTAMFGAMDIPTHGLIYLFYWYFWLAMCLAALLVPKRIWNPTGKGLWSNPNRSLPESGRKKKILFYGSMILFCLITIGLSVFYSYTWDFQPQGRYILPILIPFMHMVTLGAQKLCGMLENGFLRLKGQPAGEKRRGTVLAQAGTACGKLLCIGIIAYVLLSFAYSLFVCVLPHYSQNDSLFSLYELIL